MSSPKYHASDPLGTYRSRQGSAKPGQLPCCGPRGATSICVERTVLTVLRQIVKWVRQESPTTQALILAFIAVGIAFGWWHWTDAQTGAVMGISAALLSMFVRSQVTPLIPPVDAGQPLIPLSTVAAVAQAVTLPPGSWRCPPARPATRTWTRAPRD